MIYLEMQLSKKLCLFKTSPQFINNLKIFSNSKSLFRNNEIIYC